MPGSFASLMKSKYAYSTFAPLLALLLLGVTLYTGIFQRLENLSVDFRFKLRAPSDPPSDPRVLFVTIDQKSLDVLGQWPWSRTIHGKFCQLLAGQNPAAVSFDILFTEPGDPKGDADLANGAASLPAFISGADFEPGSGENLAYGKTQALTHVDGDKSEIEGAQKILLPIPSLRDVTLFGVVNANPSFDGIRRDVPMVFRVGSDIFPGLSLQTLCQFWKVTPDQIQVHLGRDIELTTSEGLKSIPIDKAGKMLLNYRNKNSYQAVSFSYVDLLMPLLRHESNQEPLGADFPVLQNKILVVGQTAEGLVDLGPSPLDPASPLPLVHVTALNNILRGDYLRLAPLAPVVLGWLLLSWVTLFYLREKGIVLSLVLPFAGILLYLVLAQVLFDWKSFIVPVVWPVVFFTGLHAGSTALRWLEEQQSKKMLKGVFSSYIAPSVLDVILENPDTIRLGGTSKPVTIFFSDIRAFSKLSESMGEEELVAHLNEYFEKMVDCVNHQRGTLHKYIGDAIMAAWGDVISKSIQEDAAMAVRSCLEMRAALIELNKGWAAQGRPQLAIGMGLNHGPVLVGNIGATQRREFTLIGDAVNLASRLEGATKKFKTDMIIADSVYQLIKGEFLVRTLGIIQAVGMTRPVKIFEVLDDVKNPKGLWNPEWVACYEQGMADFYARRFTEAKAAFVTCLEQRPGDGRSEHYLHLSENLLLHPPDENWIGLYVMDEK